jgi:hypothetical protein
LLFSVVLFSVVVVVPVSGAAELVVVVLDESVDFCATSGGGAVSPVAPVAPVAPAGPGGPATTAGVSVVVSLHPMDMVPAHRTRAAMAVNEAERLEIFIGLAYQDCLERIRTIDSVGYLHNQ